MLNKNIVKKFKCVLNFSIFVGIIPTSFSGILFSIANNNENIEISNKIKFIDKNTLKFKDKYISLRSNPMNNFVSLTTTKLGSGDIKEQFIYLLCDTATSQEGIRYGKNSGIAKLDYNGNVKALWTLPNTGKGQENEYIYTTNIVFDDTEETVYALCGISNPAAALNSVYGNAVVPTKINYGENTNFKDKNTAYFYRNNLAADQVFQRDLDSNYKVDITNYSFANYPKIKIYKLNANNLTQTTKYDFEFPPAATGNLNDPSTAFNEYDKTIIAGFGGGQHLNYWSTNSTWVTDYKTKSNELISLMNSSFFHYLQFGQTFDYVGNEQFMMVPTYMGIDPNLGGLYSLVNEGMTCSLSSFSSYPSLYNVFYKYKGKPSVNTITETVDFSNNTIARTSYQYQYLDGLGKKVDVTIDSEFALKESVINLILLSIGYFLPNHEWRVDDYDVDMEKVDIMYSPGFVLSVYGIICFSPLKKTVLNKYKLYVFNRYNKEYDEIEGWIISTSQFVIKNVFISKNDRGEKRYTFFSGNDYFSWHQTDLPDFYNSAVTSLFLYGTKNPMKEKRPFGFTWNEFASTYDSIRHSQLTFGYEDIKLTGVNGNSKYWFEYNDDDKEYYDNLDSILTTKEYNIDLKYPLGWHTDGYQFNDKGNLDVFSSKKDYRNQYSEFSSWSGSKYISYDNNKIIISDPIWANRLVVIDDVRKFCVSLKKDYDKSYSYNEYCDSAESFNRISTLFSLPGNIGFCYLTYNNEIKICFLGSEALDRQLKNDDFYILSSARKELSSFHSVVPVGKMLFTSVINSDKTISNGYFDINGNSSNDNTDVNGNSNGGIDANSDNIQVGNGANIWIITGICFATLMFVIALGLGIGIIVKRNLKLQLVNIKLSNKKIDMLSTITAKTLRRITENTNNLLENKRKNLITGVFVKPMKPVKPSRQIRPIQPIQSIRSAQPMQLIQPIRLIQPMRMMKSITFTKSSKPSTKVIFADSTKQTKYLSKK